MKKLAFGKPSKTATAPKSGLTAASSGGEAAAQQQGQQGRQQQLGQQHSNSQPGTMQLKQQQSQASMQPGPNQQQLPQPGFVQLQPIQAANVPMQPGFTPNAMYMGQQPHGMGTGHLQVASMFPHQQQLMGMHPMAGGMAMQGAPGMQSSQLPQLGVPQGMAMGGMGMPVMGMQGGIPNMIDVVGAMMGVDPRVLTCVMQQQAMAQQQMHPGAIPSSGMSGIPRMMANPSMMMQPQVHQPLVQQGSVPHLQSQGQPLLQHASQPQPQQQQQLAQGQVDATPTPQASCGPPPPHAPLMAEVKQERVAAEQGPAQCQGSTSLPCAPFVHSMPPPAAGLPHTAAPQPPAAGSAACEQVSAQHKDLPSRSIPDAPQVAAALQAGAADVVKYARGGMVPGHPLPPLQPGEHRCLGLTLHPAVADTYKNQEQVWLLRQRDNSDSDANEDFTKHVSVTHRTALEDAVNQGKKLGVRQISEYKHAISELLCMDDKQDLLDVALPEWLELQHVRVVVDDAGRGRGLVAAKALKAGTVLGPVAGYLLPPGFTPAPVKMGDRALPVRAQLDVQRYSFEVEMQLVSGGPVQAFRLAMFGYANAAALINDPNSYQMVDDEDDEGEEEEPKRKVEVVQRGQENVKVLVFEIRSLPFPFLVVTRDVAEGAPLLRDYSISWWRQLEPKQTRFETMLLRANVPTPERFLQACDSRLPLHADAALMAAPAGSGAGPVPPAAAPAPAQPPVPAPLQQQQQQRQHQKAASATAPAHVKKEPAGAGAGAGSQPVAAGGGVKPSQSADAAAPGVTTGPITTAHTGPPASSAGTTGEANKRVPIIRSNPSSAVKTERGGNAGRAEPSPTAPTGDTAGAGKHARETGAGEPNPKRAKPSDGQGGNGQAIVEETGQDKDPGREQGGKAQDAQETGADKEKERQRTDKALPAKDQQLEKERKEQEKAKQAGGRPADKMDVNARVGPPPPPGVTPSSLQLGVKREDLAAKSAAYEAAARQRESELLAAEVAMDWSASEAVYAALRGGPEWKAPKAWYEEAGWEAIKAQFKLAGVEGV